MENLRIMTMPLLAAAVGLLLPGCIEESTVIKVKRDGSGLIHERSYSVPTDKLISFGKLGSDKEDEKEEEKTKLPEEAALKEYAATLGEGVTFKSVKPGINKKGWKGYEIVFEFADINKVHYLKNTPRPKREDRDEEEPDKENKADEFAVAFAMEDGELAITVERERFKEEPPEGRKPAQAPGSPTIDPFADTAGGPGISVDVRSPFANEAMVKALTKGMRLGIFVEVEGEIAETNAAHQKGNLITLFSADFGKMFETEDATATMEKMNDIDRKEFQRLADQLDGFDIDLQEPVRVRWR